MTSSDHMASLTRLSGIYDGFPEVVSVATDDTGTRIEFDVSPGLCWFAGHFPGQPVLPGIVQLHWAVLVSRSLYGFEAAPLDVKRLKFKNIVVPPRVVTLAVERHGDSEVQFRFSSPGEDNSEGRIVFGGLAA